MYDLCFMIKMLHTDNMSLMQSYNYPAFDVGIIDPEYGIGESGKNHKSRNTLVRQKGGQMRRCPSTNYARKDWDEKPASPEYFSELRRTTVHQIIFGANYFESIMVPCKSPRREQFDQFLIDNPVGFIIWDKCNGTSDFNDCEIIYTSFTFPSFVLKYMWAGMMQGRSISEGHIMQGDKSLNQKRIHPTEKPIILYKYLIQLAINHIGKRRISVLDTHGGSFGNAIACYDMDVDLVICEKDKDYYDAGVKRTNAYISSHAKLCFNK